MWTLTTNNSYSQSPSWRHGHKTHFGYDAVRKKSIPTFLITLFWPWEFLNGFKGSVFGNHKKVSKVWKLLFLKKKTTKNLANWLNIYPKPRNKSLLFMIFKCISKYQEYCRSYKALFLCPGLLDHHLQRKSRNVSLIWIRCKSK